MDLRKFVTCEFSGRHVWFWPFAQYFHYQLGKGQLNYFLGSESDFFTLVFDQPVILDRNMSFRSRFVFSSGSVGPSVALSSVPVQGLLHVSQAPPEPLLLLFDPIQPCRPVSSSLVLSTLSASNLRWQCATIPLTSALALDPRRFPHRLHYNGNFDKATTLRQLPWFVVQRIHFDFYMFHYMQNVNHDRIKHEINFL